MSQSMKLVDILAREMKVWPEGARVVTQDKTGWCLAWTGNPRFAFGRWESVIGVADLDGFIGPFESSVDYSSFVTREQWQAAVDALKAPAWNGEGLPPVGVDALLKSEYKLTEGTRLESFPAGTAVYVGGHANFGGCDLAVIIIKGRHYCGTVIPSLLEPVRTAEQIAADERLHKVRNALTRINEGGLFQHDAIHQNIMVATVEAMIDAGYSK